MREIRPAANSRVAATVLAMVVSAPAASCLAQETAPPGVLRLGLPLSGVVQSILVAPGARVDAGATILKLDCRVLDEEIRLRGANLAAARAVVERARNGPRQVEIAIGLAAVGVAQARAEEAEAAYRRLAQLVEGVSITRAQMLQSRREARVTAARMEDAQKRLELLRAGTRSEEVAEVTAKHEAADASLAEAKTVSINAPCAPLSRATCGFS